MTQIFVSYSRKDLTFIERLAADLTQRGCDVWYDLSGLEGGSRWIREIEKEIAQRDYMLVVLSPDSIISENVEDEVAFAKRLKKKIIPLIYRPCEDRMLYASLNQIDMQGEKYGANFNKLLRALNVPVTPVINETIATAQTPKPQPANLPITNLPVTKMPTYDFAPQMIRIPAGKFVMGSNDYDSEKPPHTVELAEYFIGKYPVTNKEYQAFVRDANYQAPQDWNGGEFPQGKAEHPVIYVSWNDAAAYCQWLSQKTGSAYRLPTEAEWEKAARGTDGRKYAWGNEFDKNKCNSYEGGKGGTTPVGFYSPQGDSPYGCADMNGNVWEWCHSLYKPYPYKAADGREDEKNSGGRVLRGGSWSGSDDDTRSAYRGWYNPASTNSSIGFRCSRSHE